MNISIWRHCTPLLWACSMLATPTFIGCAPANLESRTDIETEANGEAAFRSARLDGDVEVTVNDDAGHPVDSAKISWLTNGDSFLLIAEDPSGTRTPAFVLSNVTDPARRNAKPVALQSVRPALEIVMTLLSMARFGENELVLSDFHHSFTDECALADIAAIPTTYEEAYETLSQELSRRIGIVTLGIGAVSGPVTNVVLFISEQIALPDLERLILAHNEWAPRADVGKNTDVVLVHSIFWSENCITTGLGQICPPARRILHEKWAIIIPDALSARETATSICDLPAEKLGECFPGVCDDRNLCTTDICEVAGADIVCSNELLDCADWMCDSASGECVPGDFCSDVECDDGDPCTDDRCDPDTEECLFIVTDCPEGTLCVDGNCVGVCEGVYCDDGDPCTIDECVDGECVDFAIVCMEGDTCVDGKCVECESDADCNDDDSCTKDECITELCYYQPVGECCSDDDCDQGESCDEADHNCVPEMTETVFAPVISGPGSADVSEEVSFVATGAYSSAGHPIDIQFDWGDGEFSPWGNASQSHVYQSEGIYAQRAKARCELHPERESTWSIVHQFTVGDVPPLPGGADLVVDRIIFQGAGQKSVVHDGESIEIVVGTEYMWSVYIRNAGSEDAGASDGHIGANDGIGDCTALPNDYFWADFSVDALESGDEDVFELDTPWTWTPDLIGTYSIVIRADRDNEVAESNETNNDFCASLVVAE